MMISFGIWLAWIGCATFSGPWRKTCWRACVKTRRLPPTLLIGRPPRRTSIPPRLDISMAHLALKSGTPTMPKVTHGPARAGSRLPTSLPPVTTQARARQQSPNSLLPRRCAQVCPAGKRPAGCQSPGRTDADDGLIQRALRLDRPAPRPFPPALARNSRQPHARQDRLTVRLNLCDALRP